MAIGIPIQGVHSVTVIEPSSGDVRPRQDIGIQDGRIAFVRPSGPEPTAGRNGAGLFALPGLVDTHVHALGFLLDEVPGPFDLPWLLRQQRRNLAAFLRSGVTTVRDMTSALRLVRRFSRSAARMEIASPRILFAGPMLTVPGGYPYFVEKVARPVEWIAGPVRVDLPPSDGTSRAAEAVDRIADAGAHCIKIGYQSEQYDDRRTPIPLLPLPLLRAITARAHARGLPAAVHHVYRKDLRDLLGATDIPFDSLEHLTIDEVLNDEEVRRLADRGIPVSTTLMTYGIVEHLDRLEALLEREPERFERKPLAFLQRACRALRSGGEVTRFIGRECIDRGSRRMRENLARLREAGVPIVYGTDSGGAITPPGCPAWELLDMVRAGMSPMEALRAATSLAAEVVRMPDLGRLAPGCVADILLLHASPLEDVSAVEGVAAVIREGRLVSGTLEGC